MSKSDNERASRIRRAMREHAAGRGPAVKDRDSKWLAMHEAERPPRAARPREPSPPADGPFSDASSSSSPPPSFFDLVDLPPAAPATAAPAPASNAPAQPGAPPATTPAHVAGGVCPVGPDCPGCRGVLDHAPKVCIKTGDAVYPQIGDAAAMGFAGLALFVIGFTVRLFVRLFHGRDVGPVAATKPEREELADAIKAAFRNRPSLGWIGATMGDLAAAANVVTSYGARQLAAPERKPDDDGDAMRGAVPA